MRDIHQSYRNIASSEHKHLWLKYLMQYDTHSPIVGDAFLSNTVWQYYRKIPFTFSQHLNRMVQNIWSPILAKGRHMYILPTSVCRIYTQLDC